MANMRTSEDDFSLSQAKIAIVGLGLMGGSLALALKGKCAALYGVDPDPVTRELAINQAIVDQVDADPAKILPLADLIILAAPVPAIIAFLERLPDLMPNPCVVLDIGSTKLAIVEKMATLPVRFEPIGGHPICGKERLSLENADRTLYYSAPFLLTPLRRTTARARAAVNQIIVAIGARAEVLSAEEHDRILACTSHLPFLLSSALALATPLDVAPFIGPGFRSASRLAGTPGSMMLGVVLSNRENLLAALERLQDELALFTAAIAENDVDSLKVSLSAAQAAYLKLNGAK
jgi:prephenate dehydrogenase